MHSRTDGDATMNKLECRLHTEEVGMALTRTETGDLTKAFAKLEFPKII